MRSSGDGVIDVQGRIDALRGKRQSNKVLHGHPSPVFWSERRVPVKDVMIARLRAATTVRKRLNLYVGTPYCVRTNPDRCGFCLFPSEVYEGAAQLAEYLKALRQEARMYAEFFEGAHLGNVYFGGGTSNLYKADQYAALVGVVNELFPRRRPEVEITLEGIPRLFSREKLEAMKAAGVTRISMGVQQLDDELIKASGRRQTAQDVFRALGWCGELGLGRSVDLIFGWPGQTIERMLAGLEAIAGAGVPHVTHYELNVAGRTDFARRRSELPSTEDNLAMYRAARDFLAGLGYRQVTAYDWEKPSAGEASRYRYEETWRAPFVLDGADRLGGADAWALGFARCSFFIGTPEVPGWAYMNEASVHEYVRALDEGRFPIARGFHYTRADLRLTSLFQMMHAMSVDLDAYRRIFGVDLLEEFAPIWEALIARGWVTVAGGHLRLVGDGVFYTPLIQHLLQEGRMAQMRGGPFPRRGIEAET